MRESRFVYVYARTCIDSHVALVRKPYGINRAGPNVLLAGVCDVFYTPHCGASSGKFNIRVPTEFRCKLSLLTFTLEKDAIILRHNLFILYDIETFRFLILCAFIHFVSKSRMCDSFLGNVIGKR